jgi:hypothetical protein
MALIAACRPTSAPCRASDPARWRIPRRGVGLLLQGVGRSLRNDAAVIDDGDALRHPLGFLHIVRGQKDRDPLLEV